VTSLGNARRDRRGVRPHFYAADRDVHDRLDGARTAVGLEVSPAIPAARVEARSLLSHGDRIRALYSWPLSVEPMALFRRGRCGHWSQLPAHRIGFTVPGRSRNPCAVPNDCLGARGGPLDGTLDRAVIGGPCIACRWPSAAGLRTPFGS
jgi:hypothetical protein